MTVMVLDATRVGRAKRAFSTRRASLGSMRTLIHGNLKPAAGDLVLARVDELGKHTKLELTDGRRAHMFPGDEIIVSFGSRYAPDQYEALIGPDLSPCDLVAAGGIAGVERSRHDRMLAPTKITPIGIIGDTRGMRLNLMQFRVEAGEEIPRIPAILSLGTSMNAGKTLTSTSMVRGLKRVGVKVAALKVTGTGAGGDMWIVRDAGADVALDFTDAGFATTYLTPIPDIERATFLLMNHAASLGCEIAMIEIADGLQQLETAQLVRSDAIRRIALGTVFAAYDAMGAKYGVDLLREAGHAVLAMSGRLSRSPLGAREAERATGLRVYTPFELQEGALVPAIRERAAERHAASGFREDGFGRIARTGEQSGPLLHARKPAALCPPTDDVGRSAKGQVIAFQSTLRPTPERAKIVLARVAASLMQTEISRICGAPFRKRTEGRSGRRNGFRSAVWESPVGSIPVRVPRLRRGHYRPCFLAQSDVKPARLLGAPLEAVLAAAIGGGDASMEAALAKLITELGGQALGERELSGLAGELRDLLHAEMAAEGTLHLPSVSRVAPAGGFLAGGGPWIPIAADPADDGSWDVDEQEGPECWRAMERIDDEGEEQPIGPLFHANHANAWE